MQKQSESSLQKTLTDNFQKMSKLSFDTMKPFIENMFETASNMNQSILNGEIPALNLSSLQTKKSSNCCPPEQKCPPQGIASISRQAAAEERIMVPFNIKNTCSTTKTYRVGVRELVGNDGEVAPTQPVLNKTSVTLEPGRSERIMMTLELRGFSPGSIYVSEIVLREREINQNICFTLHVDNSSVAEVTPYDEKEYKQKWLKWQSHFYCDPPKNSSDQNLEQ